ncbi:MAG: PEP-utilizing enzyme [bacterium]
MSKKDKIFDDDLINNKNWYEKSWVGVLNPLFLVGYGCVHILNQRVKNSFGFAICFLKNDKLNWFWDKRDIKRVREKIIRISISKPEKIDEWLYEWNKDWQNFLNVYKIYTNINFGALSDRKLFDCYEKLRNAYVIANSLPYLADAFLTSGGDDWMSDFITEELKNKKVDAKQFTRVITLLTATVENSFSRNEYIRLLAIARQIKQVERIKRIFLAGDIEAMNNGIKKHPELSSKIEEHVDEFYWIKNNYSQAERLNKKYFLQKLHNIINEIDVEQEYSDKKVECLNNKNAKKHIYKKFNISSHLKSIILTAEKFSIWQDTRKLCVFLANDFLFRFYKEMSERTGLTENELAYTIDSELVNLLRGKKIDPNKLRERRHLGCAFAHTIKGWKLYEGEEYKKIDRDIFFKKSFTAKEIKGTPAFMGKIKGFVRIVLTPGDLKNIKDGEVLVTNNTTPDFVPALKKVSAIITEQGGVTCHAAIVAREIGKPCIIGTGNATKILRDGDLVEVDAERGIVRKLEIGN